MAKFAMLSNRGNGIKLFVAEGTHSEAVHLIHKKYGELLGLTASEISRAPMLNPSNVKELDTMDFSHISNDTPQEVILCN